jgi:cytochrome c553
LRNLMSALCQAALAAAVMLTLAGPMAASADQPATFVGGQACAGCHTAQFDAWKDSHHALAMQPDGGNSPR